MCLSVALIAMEDDGARLSTLPIVDQSLTDIQSEKKIRQYEELLAQQRRIQAQMAMIDPETRREVDEVQRLEQDISRFTSGVLSEPTTPPEYNNHMYTSNRPTHRYSSASMASPPGLSLSARASRSGSLLTSPPVEAIRPFTSHHTSQLPSKSVPNSQRNSDHEDDGEDFTYSSDIRQRSAAK